MPSSAENQLKQALFAAVLAQVAVDGFKAKLPKDSFIRRRDGIVDIFQLVCLDGKPGWRIQPNVAVRIDRVEQIFHQTSGFERKFQDDTPTIGGAVGNIQSGDNRACEFLLEKQADLSSVSMEIVRVFHEFALPYFRRFGSLKEIDAELNSRPTERTPHRVAPWLRSATGMIVAKLVGRADYSRLADIYSDAMARSDKGFYLVRFQKLLQSLESIKPDIG